MAGTVRAGSTGVAGTVRIIVVRVAGAGRGGSVTAIIITVGTSAGTTTSTTTTGAIATKFWCFPKRLGPVRRRAGPSFHQVVPLCRFFDRG